MELKGKLKCRSFLKVLLVEEKRKITANDVVTFCLLKDEKLLFNAKKASCIIKKDGYEINTFISKASFRGVSIESPKFYMDSEKKILAISNYFGEFKGFNFRSKEKLVINNYKLKASKIFAKNKKWNVFVDEIEGNVDENKIYLKRSKALESSVSVFAKEIFFDNKKIKINEMEIKDRENIVKAEQVEGSKDFYYAKSPNLKGVFDGKKFQTGLAIKQGDEVFLKNIKIFGALNFSAPGGVFDLKTKRLTINSGKIIW